MERATGWAAVAASTAASLLNAQAQPQFAARTAARASVGVKSDVCGGGVMAADGWPGVLLFLLDV